ncbi:uncharacterized protein A1O5_11835 [Cladophialophora psammophila CBS 110553]|uniref:AMP-dependent synthetase/ligase domain-containing protein n=1 Tax=Cladophialophora psammophila CBS 110553 TaxID=1182543 RepID=W9W001_9EURO|nr:uncharacterized protein A1O5_11835 [Cladophialophora psammophila CBS 110553]EXJ61278.1 hypothetical protein A1O5_11835 [Cladophialophora psammophila CBS 110553]
MKIYRSEDPDIAIPDDLNLTELLHSSARSPALQSGHVIAQDDVEDRTLTIGQLRSNAGKLATGLTQQYSPKDQSRWAVILPNSVAYIEAIHAVLWLGGVFCPINHQLKAGEIAHALTVSKPAFVIVYSKVLEKVIEAIELAKQNCPDLKDPEVLTALGSTTKGLRNLYADFISPEQLPIPHYRDTRKRLASIHLSSGTTGNPKGVGLSQYNYVANVLQMWAHDPDHWSPEEKIVSYTPFVHIANTTIPLFLGPWTGMVHIIMGAFDLETYAKTIHRTRATAAQVSPMTALTIATTDLVSTYDFSTIRHMTCGPLPLKQDDYHEFLRRGKWKTVTLYGMTEAAPYVTWQKIREPMPLGKSGTLLPNILGSLRLEDGTDAPEGGPGELWLKGPNMTAGYVDNPAANRTAFDRDGWYNTGDVCTISPEGHLQVVGRTKELIKYNGFQVSPTELEAYIISHPAVLDAAVGGVWDATKMTELPTAYVVLKDHVKERRQKVQALKDIQTTVDEQVAGYKKLRGNVWEVTSLPRNATFKLLRKQLGVHKTGVSSCEGEARSSKL